MSFALLLVLFIATQLVALCGARLFSHLGDMGQGTPLLEMPVSPEASAISLLCCYLVLVGLLRVCGLVRFCGGASRPPLHRLAWVVAPVGLLLLAEGLGFALRPLGLGGVDAMAQFDALKENAFCLLLLCVVGPLAEETVFRAGMTQALVQKQIPRWMVVALPALAFALVHGNLSQGIPALLLGMVLSLLYLRTGDLRLCLPAHILNNTMAVVQLYAPHCDERLKALPAVAHLSLATLLILSGGILLWRYVFRSYSL